MPLVGPYVSTDDGNMYNEQSFEDQSTLILWLARKFETNMQWLVTELEGKKAKQEAIRRGNRVQNCPLAEFFKLSKLF